MLDVAFAIGFLEPGGPQIRFKAVFTLDIVRVTVDAGNRLSGDSVQNERDFPTRSMIVDTGEGWAQKDIATYLRQIYKGLIGVVPTLLPPAAIGETKPLSHQLLERLTRGF